jgi:hypothetical protein
MFNVQCPRSTSASSEFCDIHGMRKRISKGVGNVMRFYQILEVQSPVKACCLTVPLVSGTSLISSGLQSSPSPSNTNLNTNHENRQRRKRQINPLPMVSQAPRHRITRIRRSRRHLLLPRQHHRSHQTPMVHAGLHLTHRRRKAHL